MTPDREYEDAARRLMTAQSGMRAAETELIQAERNMRNARQSLERYKLSNEYISKLTAPQS